MKNIFIRLSVAAFAIVAMVGCGGDKAASYTNIIPEQPMMLVQVNGYKTLDEGGIIELLAPYREQAADFLGSQAGAQIRDIILDADNSGLATTEPIYLYLDSENINNPKIVVLAKVGNKDKLTSLVEFVEENVGEISLKHDGDNSFVKVEDVDEFVIGYNSSSLVVVASPDGEVSSADAKALLAKSAEPRKTPLPAFNGDSRLIFSFDALLSILEQVGAMEQIDAETLAQLELLRGASFALDNSVENGRIVSKWTVSGINAELKEMMKSMPQVANTYAANVPADAWAVVNFAINDAVVASVDKALNNILNVSSTEKTLIMSLVNTLQGDVTLSLNSLDINNESFVAQALVGTKNSDIYDYAAIGAMAMGILPVQGILSMPIDENNTANLGQNGDNTLWGGINTVYGTPSASILNAEWFPVVSDKVGYAVVNLEDIFTDPVIREKLAEELYYELDDEDAVEMVLEIIDLFDYAAAYSEVDLDKGTSSITFEVVTKNQDVDVLKQIVGIVSEKLSEVAATMF